jgi:N-dimethylarginine dimethylaminohydrolase
MPIINKSILMSDTDNFNNDQPINPYYCRETINRCKAAKEHSTVRHLLIEAGVNVTTVPSPSDSQDGVYTANWALVRGNKAVLARLPEARRAEEDYAEKILVSLGKEVVRLPQGLKFSGQGDALPCGNFLFCGSYYRSDPEAQDFVANTLGYNRIQLHTIPQLDSIGIETINQVSGLPDSFFYDLDLALAVIKTPHDGQKGLIAYCPEAFMPESRELLATFDAVDKIEVSITEAREAFATNLVSTGEIVIMSAGAPQLADDLQRHGLSVLSTNITELAKGGGFIRCITLTID